MAGATCDLILLHAGADEGVVLELLREATGLGRAEARGLIANLPQPVRQGLSLEVGQRLRRRFEEAGATLALR